MIKDIEEESKTKFSMKAEFSFSFKGRETGGINGSRKTPQLLSGWIVFLPG